MFPLLQKDAEVEKSQTNFMVLVQNLLKNPTERKRFFRVNMLMWYYTGTGCNPCISSFVVSIVFRDMPFTVYNMVKHFFPLNRKCSLFSMAQSLTQHCRL